MELRQYWAVAWRRKWLVLAIVAAAVAAAWKLGRLESDGPRYRATAVLLVSTVPGQPVAYPPEALGTVAVARDVVRETGVRQHASAVLAGLSVAPRPGTSLVDVRVENEDPAAAASLANAFAQAYLSRLRDAVSPSDRALEELRSAHEELRERAVSLARSKLDPTRKEWDLRWLQVRDELLARAYADALLRRTPSGAGDARLVDPATPPAQALESGTFRQVRTLGGLGVVALLGALALVFLIDYFDGRLRSDADVERATRLRVLATLPSRRRLRRAARRFAAVGRRHKREHGLVVVPASAIPDPRLAEAFQSMRVQIELAERERWAGRRLATLLVVSPWDGRDKTWVAAYLGAVFARAGRRTILVSADLHRPRLERLLAVEAGPGLNEAADQGLHLESLLEPTWIEGLEVVPAGAGEGHPADALASADVARVLEAAHAAADVVVIEGPPVLAGAEASVLVPHCDGVLLVVRAGKATEGEAMAATAALEKVRNGAELLGCVLTDVREPRAARRYARRRPGRRLSPARKKAALRKRTPKVGAREDGS